MEGTATSIVSALTSAFSTMADQMLEAVGAILPIALPVAGAILVCTVGMRVFKKLVK